MGPKTTGGDFQKRVEEMLELPSEPVPDEKKEEDSGDKKEE